MNIVKLSGGNLIMKVLTRYVNRNLIKIKISVYLFIFIIFILVDF